MHPGLDGAEFAAATTTGEQGVEVTSVEPGSPAAQRGLRAGDLITAVNRVPIHDLNELAQMARSSDVLFLLVRRGERSLMLQIR